MKNRVAKSIVCVVGLSASVSLAGPSLFITSGTSLYRVSLDAPTGGAAFTQFERFDTGVDLVSLTTDDQGRIWGTEVTDTNGDGNHALYSIDDAMGFPSLNLEGDFLSMRTSSIVWSQGSLYGFAHLGDQFIEIDYINDTSTVVGSLVEDTFFTSSAWDAASQSFYAIDNNALYKYTDGVTLSSTFVADLDFGVVGTSGGEIVDGIYYHAINDGEVMRIYSIDLQTGTSLELINFEVDGGGVVGLTGIVPAPGSIALLGAGGLILSRRRR